MLAQEGRVVASFCHRRLREYPVSGGPSAACESVRDERLTRYASAVIRELGWTGVAMVEFKKDDDYRLLEVNPRFWGSLPLATLAGINFPHLLCRQAMGETVSAAPKYRSGVRLRFLTLDLPAALSAPRNFPGFLCDLLVKDGIFDLRDWAASVAYLWSRLP